jgi:hypothetical protein
MSEVSVDEEDVRVLASSVYSRSWLLYFEVLSLIRKLELYWISKTVLHQTIG